MDEPMKDGANFLRVAGHNKWCIKYRYEGSPDHYVAMFEIMGINPEDLVRLKCIWTSSSRSYGYCVGCEYYSVTRDQLISWTRHKMFGGEGGFWVPVDDVEFVLFSLSS